MIGLVELIDAQQRIGEAQLARIDVFAGRDDARDGAEPDLDARRAAVDIVGQRILEHRRVELEGLAVRVEIGAREPGAQQRRSELGTGGKISSTKLSSERRSACASSRDAASRSGG